jgi:hypothetical protein
MTPASFEDILQQEFRWPNVGDQLFKPSNVWMGDAMLAGHASTRLALMTAGYKHAGDALVERALELRAERDFLVYPIIFCYRHYLELALKSMLATYGPNVSVKPDWACHRLDVLWPKFVDMLCRYGVDSTDEAGAAVGRCIGEFAKIDANSFTFRYPVTTKGAPIPVGLDRLDLEALRDTVNGIDNYFTGSDGYLDHLRSSAP